MLTVRRRDLVSRRHSIGKTVGISALLLIFTYWIRARNSPSPLPQAVKSVEVAAVAGEKRLEPQHERSR
jgi:hypothetical protein